MSDLSQCLFDRNNNEIAYNLFESHTGDTMQWSRQRKPSSIDLLLFPFLFPFI